MIQNTAKLTEALVRAKAKITLLNDIVSDHKETIRVQRRTLSHLVDKGCEAVSYKLLLRKYLISITRTKDMEIIEEFNLDVLDTLLYNYGIEPNEIDHKRAL